MKLEVGNKYLTCNRNVVTIIGYSEDELCPYIGSNDLTYTENGRIFVCDIKDHSDIICEYKEEETISNELIFNRLNKLVSDLENDVKFIMDNKIPNDVGSFSAKGIKYCIHRINEAFIDIDAVSK